MLNICTSRRQLGGRTFVSLLAMALAASLLSLPPIAAAQPPQAPDSPLPGRYIVVLKEGAGAKKGKGAGPAAVAKDHGVADRKSVV